MFFFLDNRLPRLLWLALLCTLSCAQALALEPVRVGEGVYAFLGATGEPDRSNGGNTGNSGFIVARDGIVVIDTGPSMRHGRAMIAAIRRVSDKPIVLVVNTHAVQEFLFGNSAFARIGVPLLTHRASARLMRERCAHCLENLQLLLGEDAMRGTRLVVPHRLLEESSILRVAGRDIELLHFGWGATPGDLVVLDRRSGVVFAGGLASIDRVPETRDGKHDGWIAALDALARLPARRVVPGHGPPVDLAEVRRTRAYLFDLDAMARRLYEEGFSLLEALDRSDLPAYRGWGAYATVHRRNLQQRYLELELLDLESR
jgi:glyoxylase-like metal-dependent hydrolase (beta-lactamase superfamily II)